MFVANDNCAASCMNEIKRRGIKVPDQIAFAGFNNDMISRNINPALTTVNYPGFEMVEIAARNLLGHLEGTIDVYATTKITIDSNLTIRSSSSVKRTEMSEFQ